MIIFDENIQSDVEVIQPECLTSGCYWPVKNPFTKNQNSWFLDYSKVVCGTKAINRTCKLFNQPGNHNV